MEWFSQILSLSHAYSNRSSGIAIFEWKSTDIFTVHVLLLSAMICAIYYVFKVMFTTRKAISVLQGSLPHMINKVYAIPIPY